MHLLCDSGVSDGGAALALVCGVQGGLTNGPCQHRWWRAAVLKTPV